MEKKKTALYSNLKPLKKKSLADLVGTRQKENSFFGQIIVHKMQKKKNQ